MHRFGRLKLFEGRDKGSNGAGIVKENVEAVVSWHMLAVLTVAKTELELLGRKIYSLTH